MNCNMREPRDARAPSPDPQRLIDALARAYREQSRASEAQRHAARRKVRAAIKALRHYIYWLETDADPAGTIQQNWRLTQENAALRKLLKPGK